MPRSAPLDGPGVLHHLIMRGIERQKISRSRELMIKRLVCIFSCALVIGGGGVPAYAQAPEVDLTVGTGTLRGHTTYRIGGTVGTASGSYDYHFPISELEFPLDVYMFSVRENMQFAEKWKVSAGVKSNITKDAGKMKDSDWGVYFLQGYAWAEKDTLDIYSKSDAELDAFIWDINLGYRFYEKSNWSLITGLGYIRQKFDYEISDLNQWYPSDSYYFGVDSPHDYVRGKVLKYEVTYSIPYVEIGTQLEIRDKFSVEASLGYCPIVNVNDEDHHLLRSKVNKGDCDGDAILFSVEGRYDFPNNWFLTLQLDYTKIDANGESKAYFGGVYDHTIDLEIESRQVYTILVVGYVF
jgi:outer membrane protease